MIILYIILLSISVVLFVVNLVQKLRSRKRLYKPKKLKLKLCNKLTKYLLLQVNKHNKLSLIINIYANRLSLFNLKSKIDNEYIISLYLLVMLIISFAGGIIASFIFAMWYAPVVVALVSMFLLYYLLAIYININLNKIYGQFPIALQIFTDEYVITKNIKNALNEAYIKMPKEIGYIFENLSRKIDARNYNEILKSFADGLDLIWGYAFVEILTLSYEGADDISEELIYLNELTNDEMKEDEETATSIAESYSIFVVLNVITTILFIFNIVISVRARELYFQSALGNAILLFWLVCIIIGICTSNLLKKI